MKEKVVVGVIVGLCIFAVGHSVLNRNSTKNTYNTAQVTQQVTEGDFKVKSAFADVDLDMVIQDKDDKDDDTSADYVFLKFTCNVGDNKKDDDTNPLNIKAYKLDGNPLPKNTKIYAKSASDVVIKLPDGTLKGVNTPHSLDISKNLLDLQGKKVQADVNLKLPYSNSNSVNSTSNSTSNTTKDTNTSSKTSDNNTSSNKDNKNKTESSSVPANANMPKYEIQLGKAIPYATVILIKLDTTEPENYKVTVDGVGLELKKNNKGEKNFIGAIKKEYEMDQVKQLLKIEKTK